MLIMMIKEMMILKGDDDRGDHGGGDDNFQFCDVALGLISCPPLSRL